MRISHLFKREGEKKKRSDGDEYKKNPNHFQISHAQEQYFILKFLSMFSFQLMCPSSLSIFPLKDVNR